MTPYDKVLSICERMLEDYQKGIIPTCFKPYFDWKLGRCELSNISKEQAMNMMELVSNQIDEFYEKHPHPFEGLSAYVDDNPWQNYEGFGEDKYIVSYLEAIDYELTNLWTGGCFTK